MSATIRNTVATAVSAQGINPDSGQYRSYIDAVVSALEEREFTITETIVNETSSNFGVPAEVVAERVKAATALEFRPIPEPVEEEVSDEVESDDSGKGGKGKRLTALENKIEVMAQSIERLTALATRHLGSL